MRPSRFLPLALLLTLPTMAMASGAHETSQSTGPSDAQKAFTMLKTVAGSWVGPLTTTPTEPSVEGKFAQLSLRETSMGNALVHEMSISSRPDHPVTMFYLEGDRLLMTHYCDAGNRPRMAGKLSPDGKTLEFEYLDLSGGDKYGHMHHAVFTFIDDTRHTEEWTYMMPGDKPVRARFDLQRTQADSRPPTN